MPRRMKSALAALLALSACASVSPSYGPAASANDNGYREQRIETTRYRVSYRAPSATVAEEGVLRRAAELTIAEGRDYFTVVTQDTERLTGDRSGPSVGIGGSSRSGGRIGVGVGVGVQLPLGGSSTAVLSRMEIIMASGETPDGPEHYTARDVLLNLAP